MKIALPNPVYKVALQQGFGKIEKKFSRYVAWSYDTQDFYVFDKGAIALNSRTGELGGVFNKKTLEPILSAPEVVVATEMELGKFKNKIVAADNGPATLVFDKGTLTERPDHRGAYHIVDAAISE